MRTTSIVTSVLLAALIALSTYALTAANTVPATNAGQGSGAIVGYAVSGTSYTLDVTSPQLATSTSFTLDAPYPAAVGTVRAKFGSAAYQNCSLSSSTASTSTWSCSLEGTSVVGVGALQVAASQ